MQVSNLSFTGSRRLAPYLAASLALLGALLAGVTLPRPAPVVTPPLQLALARPASAPATSGEIPTPIAAATPRAPLPMPERVTARGPSAATAHHAEPVASAPPATPAAAKNSAHVSARVIAQVRAAFERYFNYPWVARHRGWQGEVLLGFSVTPEGRIDRVEVVRGSGHPLLDEAARASLVRVGSVPDYTGDGARDLQLPVVYRLAEG